MARHMQACLVLRQFEYILNVTEYISENYLRVKEKFLKAIDYVENINVDKPTASDTTSRHKRDSENLFDTRTTPEEIRYLTQLLAELAAWDPTNNTTPKKEKVYPTLCFNWSCYWFHCECWSDQENQEKHCYITRSNNLTRSTNYGIG